MLILNIKMHKAQEEMQWDGVPEFQLILQSGHHFDRLSHALSSYRHSNDTRQRHALKNTFQRRYQVVRGMLEKNASQLSERLAGKSVAIELIQDARGFAEQYEELILETSELDDGTVQIMVADSRDLSGRLHDLAIQELERNALLEQTVIANTAELSRWVSLCTGGFILTSLLTAIVLFAQNKKTAFISQDALKTESKLSNALDEKNTSDQERRALNSFVAAASHDLRQPLHALGLYLGALRSQVSTTQGQTILENSVRSTEALNQLLNSMLDLSRLDAGVVEVELADVRLIDIFHRLYQTHQPDAEDRRLELTVEQTDLVVRTDPVLLERILGNLVSNALNYTDYGSVVMAAAKVDEMVQVSVTDTGQGIAESEQQLIYDEYYQLYNPERDRTKGLGLGLSIVKRLTSLLNIQLHLKSEKGVGSRFTLSVEEGSLDSLETTSSRPERQTETNLNGLSILVIDDESDVREGMGTLLEQYHCEVVCVESADLALTHIIDNEWVPDLIIADYRLKDDNKGDMAIKLVREEVNEDVPAVIITGDTSPSRLREATSSGFSLMHKPVMANVLMDNISKLIGEHA